MHGLEETDRMASANLVPWHFAMTRDRTRVVQTADGRGLTRDQMVEASGLTWTVSARPIASPSFLLDEQGERILHPVDRSPVWDWSKLVQVTDRHLVRDDTGKVLARVGKVYEIMQNEMLFDFVAKLMSAAENHARFETAGSLWGGKKTWACVRLDSDFGVRRLDGTFDAMEPYLVVLNDHGGKVALGIYTTLIRPVCQNTINVFRIHHIQTLDRQLAQVTESLKLATQWQAQMRVELEALEQERLRRSQVRAWAAFVLSDAENSIGTSTIDGVVNELREAEKSERYIEEVVADADKVDVLFCEGLGNHGETKYDAFQGLAEFLDHQRQRYGSAKGIAKLERRMDDIMFGDTKKRKERALRVLTRW